MKVLGPTTDFPIWGSGKGTENLREFDFEGQWNLITELPQDWGNRDPRRAQTKPCADQDPRERSSGPTGDSARLDCKCLGVSGGGVSQQWPALGSEALTTAVLGARTKSSGELG